MEFVDREDNGCLQHCCDEGTKIKERGEKKQVVIREKKKRKKDI